MYNEKEYMYVFVRQDLSVPQQIVQASHACTYIGDSFHPDTSIVLLECPDLKHLTFAADYLSEKAVKFRMFFETDINEHTALATEPLKGVQRTVLKKFKLHKG